MEEELVVLQEAPVDLHYIPQASIDRRHGGRHLHGRGGPGKDGKKGCHKGAMSFDKGEGEHFEGRGEGRGPHRGGEVHGKNGERDGRRGGNHERGGHRGGKHGRHHGHHGRRGHHMKYCFIASAAIYAAIVATFVGIFKKFTMVFKSYDNLKKMDSQSRSMSIDERNRIFNEVKVANKK